MASRINRKKEKRKKRGFLKKTLLVLVVLFIAVASYAGIQYYQGLQQANPSAEMESDYEFNPPEEKIEGKYNVLLLGVDARGEEDSRTDTIMIAQYDTETEETKLVSLMRDSYVEIPGYSKNKINTAFFHGGPELLRKTIKHNFDIDIHYYALVDFKGFEQVVDTIAPDGIEMDVEKRMSHNIGVTLEPGVQNLNGKELLGYARFRHDAEGDFGRVKRQQKVISKVKDEFTSLYGISKLPKVMGTIQPYIDTNMRMLTAVGLAKDVMLKKGEIDTMKIPVDNTWNDPTYPGVGQVLEMDIEENKQALQDFLGADENSTNMTTQNEDQEPES